MPQKRGRLRRPCLCLSARGIAAQKPDLFRMSRDSKMMELPPTGRRNYDSGTTTQHQNLLRGRMKSTAPLSTLRHFFLYKTASSPRSFSSGVTDRSRARWQTRSQSVQAEIRFSIQIRGAGEREGGLQWAFTALAAIWERVKRIPPALFVPLPSWEFQRFPLPHSLSLSAPST